MYKEPKSLREIHRIRERKYAEFRGLSIHEQVLTVKESSKRFMEEFGLELEEMRNEENEKEVNK